MTEAEITHANQDRAPGWLTSKYREVAAVAERTNSRAYQCRRFADGSEVWIVCPGPGQNCFVELAAPPVNHPPQLAKEPEPAKRRWRLFGGRRN